MQDKLQQLTDKLYNEGLSKGQKEAEDILAKAKEEAKQIINNARKEAENILDAANKQLADLKINADAEIKMAARQIIGKTKQAIENIIVATSVSPANQYAFNSTAFIKDIIKIAIIRFNPSDIEGNRLSIVLPDDKKDEFKSFIDDKALKEMNSGIDVVFDKRFKVGFKISPQNGAYYVSFTDSDFENLFREFLRPKIINLLFNNQ
jgi:V/A-type H+-transporting ATPase subunit E